MSDLGAVGGHQVGEEAEEGDGGVVGDQLHHLHHGFGQAGEELGDQAVGTRPQIHAEAEEDGEDDQGQHGAAAEQAGEVARR